MLGDITRANNIFVVTGYTDMRRSIDGLYQNISRKPAAMRVFVILCTHV